MQSLGAISKQLQKNTVVQHKHSPGLPTAIASNEERCIAIGTDRSLVLVFDSFQEVRQILGNTANADNNGPVTSLDLSSNSISLIVGFVSGRIVLWDIVKGTIIKSLSELHAAPVTTLRFFESGGMTDCNDVHNQVHSGRVNDNSSTNFSGRTLRNKLSERLRKGGMSSTSVGLVEHVEISFVSVDSRGCVNKVDLSRTMLGMSYNTKIECLLDGAAGQVPAMAVLPPWPNAPLKYSHNSTFKEKLKSDTMSCVEVKICSLNNNPILGFSFIALSSERSTFVASLEPNVRVAYKWARPGDILGDASEPFLPCLSWGWALVKGGGSLHIPVLARCWGYTLQLLEVVLAKRQSATDTADSYFSTTVQGESENEDKLVPRFRVLLSLTTPTAPLKDKNGDTWVLKGRQGATDAIVEVEWLGSNTLVWLDESYKLYLFDTMTFNVVDVIDVFEVKPVYAVYIRGHVPECSCEKTAAYLQMKSAHVNANNSVSTDDQPGRVMSFMNSLRACNGELFMLGRTKLTVVRAQSWLERSNALIDNGEWLEALALALDHYESSVKPFEIDSRLVDIPSNKKMTENVTSCNGRPEYTYNQGAAQRKFSDVSLEAQQAATLLLQYINVAIKNVPTDHYTPSSLPTTSLASQSSHSNQIKGSNIDLLQSHYQMIAGVCIEFCVVLERLDLLFGDIFNQFVAASQTRTFLDLLEPYILCEKITHLAPEIMAAYIDNFQHKGNFAAIERCLLHMDVKVLDFNSIIGILRKHRLYSALVHVYTSGLDGKFG